MNSLTQADKDDVRGIVHEETHDLREELQRQGVLLEDLDSKLDVVTEMLSSGLKIKQIVDTHEVCITDLEQNADVLKPIVTLHTKQLKTIVKADS